MKIPQFIVVGAHKGGTTSLHFYLKQHPQIFLPRQKGSDLITRRRLNSLAEAEEYLSQFDEAKETDVLGEVSSVYLHREGAAPRIKTLFPDVKIIAVLRNPIDRAFSHALWARDYTQAEIRNLDDLIMSTDKLLLPGLYGRHVEAYFNCFDRTAIQLMRYDDLLRDSEAFVRELYQFVGVDETFVPNVTERYHSGQLQLNNTSRRLLTTAKQVDSFLKPLFPKALRHWVRETLTAKSHAPKPKMSSDLKKRLRDYYYDDVMQLQAVTGLDYSSWLEI